MERTGIRIKLLQKNDPMKNKDCGENGRFVRSTSEKGNCRKPGITYSITCNEEVVVVVEIYFSSIMQVYKNAEKCHAATQAQ